MPPDTGLADLEKMKTVANAMTALTAMIPLPTADLLLPGQTRMPADRRNRLV